jgi:hypothetical protein
VKILLAALLVLLFSVTSLSAAEPTLQETQEWISRNIVEGSGAMVNENYYSKTPHSPRWEGCKFSWSSTSSSSSGKDRESSYRLNLKDLDPSKIEGKAERDAINGVMVGPESITLNTTDRKKVIFDNSGEPDEKVHIAVSADMQERFKKAFRHAIKLCGGKESKPEAF